ncbi:uncharacterized protein LOC125384429 [Haliotis rufescens]|uniref:uncharacterized protein LOC125384429 n=1 Tax=Haliotis rufescens TaxID=6454 RepID=UPI00201F64C9|nr:uncharacterized protein LOC125384429 [Haliotis rufescens]
MPPVRRKKTPRSSRKSATPGRSGNAESHVDLQIADTGEILHAENVRIPGASTTFQSSVPSRATERPVTVRSNDRRDQRPYQTFPRNWSLPHICSYIKNILNITAPSGLTRQQYQQFYTDNFHLLHNQPSGSDNIPDNDRNSQELPPDIPPQSSVNLSDIMIAFQSLKQTVENLQTHVQRQQITQLSQPPPPQQPPQQPQPNFSVPEHFIMDPPSGPHHGYGLYTARFAKDDPFAEEPEGNFPALPQQILDGTTPEVEVVSTTLRRQICEDGQIQEASSQGRQCAYPMSSNHSNQHSTCSDLNKLWSQALSTKTQAVYKSGLHNFLNFMAMCSVRWWPAALPPITEQTLLCFVAHCFYKLQYKCTTIRSYLAAVRFAYLRHGIENPWSVCNTLRLETIMKAIQRIQSVPAAERLPITIHVLRNLCFQLDKRLFNHYTNMLLQAVFSLAFYAFLRCDEFTCAKYVYQKHLSMNSITFNEEYTCFDLFLKQSKTDQLGKGVTITVHAVPGPTCPVQAMKNYVNLRNQSQARASDPLFLTDCGIPLHRDYFIHKLHQTLAAAGYDYKKFNGHSFRIGAATSAAAAHVPDHMIKALGRWKSDCYARYIRVDKGSIAAAQRNIAHT